MHTKNREKGLIMPKFRVKFELVSTAYAYIEADSDEQAGDFAMELFGCDEGSWRN